jgi:hypothetical protein
MKKILSICLVMMLASTAAMAEQVTSSKNNPQFLYAMSAKSGSFKGDTLTLKDVPVVVYFSDRPNRLVGHMSLKKFVASWNKGPGSFKADPPNAALSIFDGDKAFNVVVELKSSKIIDGAIQFKIKMLKGKVPSSFKISSLFVDPDSHPTVADVEASHVLFQNETFKPYKPKN